MNVIHNNTLVKFFIFTKNITVVIVIGSIIVFLSEIFQLLNLSHQHPLDSETQQRCW